ncbi:hypothetical protein DL93DRAFT_356924 [Clavulina sp. PMI_390]|nr:hypothetical protein DL93DRAFT_356924 [Clavulina sp. PMI_390]
MPPYPREASQHVPIPQRPPPPIETDDEGADSADELPNFQPNVSAGIPRPASGISRYRTPMGMSTGIPASYTPPIGGFSGHPNSAMPHIMHQPPIPPSQPLPRYATPSAFSPPSDDRNLSSTSPSIPSSYPTASLSYPPHLSHSQTQPYAFRGNVGPNPQSPPVNDTPSAEASTSPPGHLEHAVESVQASLAALRERLEGLEVHTFGSNPTLLVRHPDGTESGADGSGSEFVWDPKSMGLWSIVFVPATHVLTRIRYVLVLILSSPASQRVLGRGGRRPGGIDVRAIVRRLVLDATFVVVAFHLLKAAWRASGVRRREVVKALRLVWFALVGKPAPRRIMIDRGV